MKTAALVIVVLSALSGFCQNTLNNYKYVMVPTRYSFSKSENQYDLNTLTKAFLEDKGFVAFMASEQFPAEVVANNCQALRAEVTENNGLLATKLTLILRDCQGNVVFKGKEGRSREKDFKTAYTMALTDAFASLNALAYNFEGPAATTETPAVTTNTPAPVTQPAPSPTSDSTRRAAPAAEDAGVLYAQPIANGYQLVDTSPKKVMTLLKTSMQDYFIVDDKAMNGVVFKKNGEWLLEYYKDNKLVSQKLQIKF